MERAIVCKQPFGHAAEPWKTFEILSKIERDAGRPEAAFEARRRAIEAYLAYRRDGGENQSGGITGQLCEGLLGAVQEGQLAEFGAALDQLDGQSDNPPISSPSCRPACHPCRQPRPRPGRRPGPRLRRCRRDPPASRAPPRFVTGAIEPLGNRQVPALILTPAAAPLTWPRRSMARPGESGRPRRALGRCSGTRSGSG